MSISPNHDDDDDDEERVPTPPPPPRISKISIGFNKPAPKVVKNVYSILKQCSV